MVLTLGISVDPEVWFLRNHLIESGATGTMNSDRIETSKGPFTMKATISRSVTALAASAAVGLAALSLTPGAVASATASDTDPHDKGGPVVYLNRHGGPVDCGVYVEGLSSGPEPATTLYTARIFRPSCDGTMWLPPNATKLRIMWATLFYENTNPVIISDVRNDEAICLLAKADSHINYTNRSPKGGDCNGD